MSPQHSPARGDARASCAESEGPARDGGNKKNLGFAHARHRTLAVQERKSGHRIRSHWCLVPFALFLLTEEAESEEETLTYSMKMSSEPRSPASLEGKTIIDNPLATGDGSGDDDSPPSSPTLTWGRSSVLPSEENKSVDEPMTTSKEDAREGSEEASDAAAATTTTKVAAAGAGSGSGSEAPPQDPGGPHSLSPAPAADTSKSPGTSGRRSRSLGAGTSPNPSTAEYAAALRSTSRRDGDGARGRDDATAAGANARDDVDGGFASVPPGPHHHAHERWGHRGAALRATSSGQPTRQTSHYTTNLPDTPDLGVLPKVFCFLFF